MSDSPATRRKWSLKKKLLVFVGLPFLLLVGFLLILDALAGRQLNSALHEAREDGGPVTFKELEGARKVWSDEQNGAKIIVDLAPRLDQLAKDGAFKILPYLTDKPDPPLGTRLAPEDLDAAEAVLQKLAPELASIDRLKQYAGGCFPVTIAPCPIATLLPSMAPLRTSAKLKASQAVCRAMRGDTSQLVDDLTIIHHHALLVEEDPFVISSLVGIAIDGLTLDTLERSLALTSTPPEVLRGLDDLLATMEGRDRLSWGIRGERALFMGTADYVRANGIGVLNSMNSVGDGSDSGVSPAFSSRATAWIPGLRGLLLQDEANGLRLYNRMVAALKDRKNASTILRKNDVEVTTMPPYYVLSRTLVPSLGRCFTLDQRTEAEIRSARAGLAVERYRLDTGHFPASLNELVPKYLPAVPIDPFDGQPLRYLNDPYGVVIYSVDEDGKDDGGQVASRRPDGRNATDSGFSLLPPELRGRPATQPATAPATGPATSPSGETPEQKAERLRRFREGVRQ